MSAAQMLKTSVLVNFLGYIADVDPGPTLVVEPRSEDAKSLSKDRVAPLFRHSPVPAWKDRGGQVARLAKHGDAQGLRQRLGAHHVHGRDLALRPGHAADPVSAAGRGGPLSRERGFGRRSGVAGDAAHRRVRAQQEGAHVLDAHHRRGEPDTGGVERERPARVLRAVPDVQSLPGAGPGRRHGRRAGVARRASRRRQPTAARNAGRRSRTTRSRGWWSAASTARRIRGRRSLASAYRS